MDKANIQDEALKALTLTGEITTLDLKNKLRSDGNWVSQSEVSEALADLYSKGDLLRERKAGDQFFTYTLPLAPVGKPAVDPANLHTSGMWRTFHKATGKSGYADGALTRDQARYRFAKEIGTTKDHVRATRVK